MSTVNTSTIVTATVATAAAGALGYAIYFDYRRRNDLEFRRSLKRESKRTARAAKMEAEEGANRERNELRKLVDEANEEGYPVPAEEKEVYFMERLAQGEALAASPDKRTEAALAFFKALKVYPQPRELMSLFDKTVSKTILDTLAQMVAYDHSISSSSSSASSAAGGIE